MRVVHVLADTQAARLSEDGARHHKRARQQPEPTVQLVFVAMAPITLSVLGPYQFPQLAQVRALVGSVVSPRGREQVDCAMIAFRAWLAGSNIPGMTEMSVEQLVCGRSSMLASTAQLEVGGVEGPAQPVRQQRVRLPALPPVLQHIDVQLGNEQFAALVNHFTHDPRKPYAYVGPGSYKADAWVLMRTPDTSPAAPSGEPLIIYVSSKQRAGKQHETVHAQSIMNEARKDVWQLEGVPYVYVYVTDQRLADDVGAISDERIVVVGPLQHEAFYGSAWALVQLMKE